MSRSSSNPDDRHPCFTVFKPLSAALLLPLLLLGADPADAFEWTIDAGNPPGTEPSVAIRADGWPAMAYLWSAYPIPPELRFRSQSSDCSWSEPMLVDGGDSGYHCELASDLTGTSHIAYLKKVAVNTYELWYAKATYGSYYWTTSKVADARLGPLSLTLDASNRPHIFFHGTQVLQYRRWTGSAWTNQGITFDFTSIYPNVDIALGVRSDGVPCFVVQRLLDGVRYIQGNNWTWQNIEDLQEAGGPCAIDFDPTGLMARIAYMRRLAGEAYRQPRLARSQNSQNTQWSVESLFHPPSSSAGEWIDLEMTAADKARIVYSSTTTSSARYLSEGASGQWEIEGVPGGLGLGTPSLAMEHADHAIIGYSKSGLQVVEAKLGTADVTSPGPIQGLEAVAGVTTAALQWTATGDDGYDGQARNYDVRYSTTPISDEISFLAANQVSGPLDCPGPVWSSECASVSNLAPCSPYYFAVRVRDNAGNWSPVSPAAFAITKCSGFEVFGCSGGGLAMNPSRERESDQADAEHASTLRVARVNSLARALEADVVLSSRDAREPITLRILDLQGRAVREIFEGSSRPGTNSFTWDLQDSRGTRVASGAYFLVLTIGSRKLTRTVAVLR